MTTITPKNKNLTFEDLRGLRAEGYVRDSTLDQKDGFGPDIQRNDILRFADSYGVALGNRWYTEFVSGRHTSNRSQFQQFIEDAHLDLFDVLLVDHTSRFGRNQAECIRFKEELQGLGKVVVFVSQGIISGSDRDFLNERINETLDEQYSRNLSRYVSAGLAEKASQGISNGKPALGYKSEKLPNGKREHKIQNPETMQVLLELLQAYSTGNYSYPTLAEHLNSMGYRTNHARPFTKGSVEHVLQNRFYEGKAVYHPGRMDEEVREGAHEVPSEIIDLWRRCQVVKAENTRQQSGRPRILHRAYPFARISTCKSCGAPYTGQPVLRPNGRVVRRLYHRRPFCHVEPHSIRVERLMDQFQQEVMPYMNLDPDWRRLVLTTLGMNDSEIPSVDEISRLDAAMENIRKQHKWGDLTDGEYRSERQQLEKQKQAAIRPERDTQVLDLDRAAELLNDLPSLWSNPGVNDNQREEFIKEVFEDVQIDSGKIVAIKPNARYELLFAYLANLGVSNGRGDRI